MNTPILTMRDVCFSYGNKKILSNINLNIEHGTFLGLIGPNGGGKTTLIQLMLGLMMPDRGKIKIYGKDIATFKKRHQIGFVSQRANNFNKGFPATAYEVVAMGLTTKIGYFRFLRRKHKAKIMQALEQVGMEKYADYNIGQLSGGQQQRILIARALVSQPDFIILDEPTVGIDYKHVEQFYNLLKHLNLEEKITLLLVTHETDMMAKFVEEVVCLNEKIHFHGSVKDYIRLSEDDLAHYYNYSLAEGDR